ncbi:PepSY-associated TM helix domain-containing protein [Pleionea sediminis]|uniref:PepSY-associated TM helix domain-containing protein n=1 Tax=Pleionea sediminis TaxID=2569479 RepID=UPI001186FF80|nr:PepSY-associated TM helix domain-containing protein [Pleionea sediminis]
MNRKTLINLHLISASFFAPVLVIIGLSGGLYLLDIKGENVETIVYSGDNFNIDFSADDRNKETERVLKAAGIEHSFDYTRGNSDLTITRPTSQTHFMLELKNSELVITKREPSLIRSLIELHKGHGPTEFKWFQKFVSLALLFILISGLFLGLTSPMLRNKTIVISGAGVVSVIILAML